METQKTHRLRKRIIAILVVLLVLFSAASFAFDRYALGKTYARHDRTAVSVLPTYEAYAADYPREDYEFQLDGYTLRGHLYGPGNTRGLIIFRHGIFSQHQDYLSFITAAVDLGWRVFAYDAIGCGESDGESTLGMSQSPLDVAAAVDYVREEGLVGEGEYLVLWGHSWGGYGVAAALSLVDGVDGCITMSGFDTPMKILAYSAKSIVGPIGATQTPFLWLNTVIDFGNNANISASDAIADSDVPTLVFHGFGDTTVPYDNVSILDALEHRWFGLAGQPIGLVTLAEPGRYGHNDYFYSRESQQYFNECMQELNALLEANGGDASAPEVQEYLASVDIRRANTADSSVMEEVEIFLNVYCPER